MTLSFMDLLLPLNFLNRYRNVAIVLWRSVRNGVSGVHNMHTDLRSVYHDNRWLQFLGVLLFGVILPRPPSCR